MRRLAPVIGAFALLLLLGACAQRSPLPPDASAAPPLLRLAPATLGRTLAVQQRLTVQFREQTRTVEVLLEVDRESLQLALIAAGQIAARLQWDGRELQIEHAPWWPQAVSGERILSDLQLVLWPAVEIEAALPPGWSLSEDYGKRVLRRHDEVMVTVRYETSALAELVHASDGYRLLIESHDLEPGA